MSNTPLILIVADEQSIRNMLTKLIHALGYQSLQATGSSEVLDLAGRHRPDLVLLDIITPDSDSIEMLRAMKQNKALSSTSIIMMSDADNLNAVTESIHAGADDFLLKPFNATLLNTRVTHALEHMRHQHEMEAMQSSLAEYRMKLQQANSSREDFCRSLSHDINNSLTGILMTAELMLTEAESDQQQENIGDIIDSAEQVSTLIKQRRKSLAQDS